VRVPLLRKRVALPHLAATTVPICPIVPLHEARVHRPTHRRRQQRQGHGGQRSEHHPRTHVHDPVVLADLVDGRIRDLGRHHLLRLPRTATPTGAGRRHHLPIRLANGRRVHRIFVRGHQPHRPPAGPLVEVANQLVRGLLGPLADHQTHDQPALGVQGHVIPAVAVLAVALVAILLLFADETPLFIELDFVRRRGKKPRVPRGVARRAGPPGVCSG